jgi:hypothetical protein
MNPKRIALLVIFLVAFLPVRTWAQSASITGTVTDATGAVPQAKITAKNLSTNAPRTAVTDESGIYRLTSLAPGNYDALIEKPGFKSVEFSQIALAAVQNLYATLAVSGVQAEIKVTGGQLLLSI